MLIFSLIFLIIYLGCNFILFKTFFISIILTVPFSEVTLSPFGVVNVPENTDFTFNCSAKGGRPEGTITWHKDVQEVSATSSEILPYGSFFNVISTLTISFQKRESGTILYCTAKNIDGDEAKKSMKADIVVKCKYS